MELIIVDDASEDGTADEAEQFFATNTKTIVLRRTKRPSLGTAIGEGIAIASSDICVVMDTDFTHNPYDLPRLIHNLQSHDLVIGSRFVKHGGMSGRFHFFASRIFNILIRMVLMVPIRDNLGGFFVARKPLLENLPVSKVFFGYGDYFFRLSYYATRAEARIIEIPTQFQERIYGKSKSNFLKLLFQYSHELLKFRIHTFLHGVIK